MHKPLIDPLIETTYTDMCPETVARRRLRRERLRWLLEFSIGMAVTLAGFLVGRMFR
jgi:hypothetical protein